MKLKMAKKSHVDTMNVHAVIFASITTVITNSGKHTK